jgi:hypothetical protein
MDVVCSQSVAPTIHELFAPKINYTQKAGEKQ